ncbi:MAG: YerC/YecD family TrpR-related protein [bacterium]|nr:YerC/YecD family TrpR-related protein [bacterium]
MAKFSKASKLPHRETQSMIMDLCAAIAATHNITEAAQLLTDLLGKQELEMLSKRLKIAELLLNEDTYEKIKTRLKVSDATIARVHSWIQRSGEGYRLTLKRTKSKRNEMSKADQPVKLSAIKKKYPMYFWPQILLEQWVKSANQKEKKNMKAVLDKLGEKRSLYKELDFLLKNNTD